MSHVGIGKHALVLMMHTYALSAREMHLSDNMRVTNRSLQTVGEVLQILVQQKKEFCKAAIAQKDILAATLLQQEEDEEEERQERERLAALPPKNKHASDYGIPEIASILTFELVDPNEPKAGVYLGATANIPFPKDVVKKAEDRVCF